MGEPVRTALYSTHVRWNGNMVDFHGFELPIWYLSMLEEHHTTRNAAGLFDVSHMGSFRFKGNDVAKWMDSVGTQRASKFSPGRCGYTHFLDSKGCLIDDMIFAVVSETEILGVPNASMIPIMWEWLNSQLPSDGSIIIEDLSPDTSILALQGPNSPQICESILGPNNVVGHFKWKEIEPNDLGIEGWIQGTGYTGERGFEIFIPNEQAERLWEALLSTNKDSGIVPVGLGARDTLRMEKGYLLSGQDFLWDSAAPSRFDEDIGQTTPEPFPTGYLSRGTIETNVPFGLDLEHDFIGKEKMLDRGNSNIKWWGMKVLDKGPFPRTGTPVYKNEEEYHPIGWVTSGGPSPSLGRVGIAIGYLDNVSIGDTVVIAPNPKRKMKAEIVKMPFV